MRIPGNGGLFDCMTGANPCFDASGPDILPAWLAPSPGALPPPLNGTIGMLVVVLATVATVDVAADVADGGDGGDDTGAGRPESITLPLPTLLLAVLLTSLLT